MVMVIADGELHRALLLLVREKEKNRDLEEKNVDIPRTLCQLGTSLPPGNH